MWFLKQANRPPELGQGIRRTRNSPQKKIARQRRICFNVRLFRVLLVALCLLLVAHSIHSLFCSITPMNIGYKLLTTRKPKS
jgi:hypothetical protein